MTANKDTVKFLFGFFGMISLGFVFLVVIGFYQVEYGGGQDLSPSSASVKP